MPEIQYLAYLHNAEDQLRGEAATLQFFSQGRYRNGMVVRIAGLGYQQGFGGHFHNDDAVGVLRDIPGLVIASPGAARRCGRDAAHLPRVRARGRRGLRLPRADRALPHARPARRRATRAGSRRPRARRRSARRARHGDGGDLTIVTWANGLRMWLRVARRLEAPRRPRARARSPLARAAARSTTCSARRGATGRVLVVDETRRTGGVSEGVVTALVDAGSTGAIARVASKDSFIPLGDASNLVLVSEDEIEDRLRPRTLVSLSPAAGAGAGAICDTFAPGSAARGAPEAILEAAPPRDLAQLKQLLTVFALRFPGHSAERREAVLRSWADSRLTLRRTAFQALRKAALHFDAVLPGSPAYEANGYPGALGPGTGRRRSRRPR